MNNLRQTALAALNFESAHMHFPTSGVATSDHWRTGAVQFGSDRLVGGQMADFNNDSKLDVYVPSGFFSAPESIAGDIDL
jgi:hypothetical protein